MTDLKIFGILIALGYFFGKWAERRHYASIILREKKFAKLPTTSTKKPLGNRTVINTELACGRDVAVAFSRPSCTSPTCPTGNACFHLRAHRG